MIIFSMKIHSKQWKSYCLALDCILNKRILTGQNIRSFYVHVYSHNAVTSREQSQQSITQIGEVQGPGEGVGPLVRVVRHQEEVKKVVQRPEGRPYRVEEAWTTLRRETLLCL
mgnify:CR=1 FL=1